MNVLFIKNLISYTSQPCDKKGKLIPLRERVVGGLDVQHRRVVVAVVGGVNIDEFCILQGDE